MLRDAPGEEEVVELFLGRGAASDDLEVGAGDPSEVAVLHQETAGDRLDEMAG